MKKKIKSKNQTVKGGFSMKTLPINCTLNEKTRIKTIMLYKPDGIYDMHCGLGDDKTIYLTEHGKPDNVSSLVRARNLE
jgi:hypothetical protein